MYTCIHAYIAHWSILRSRWKQTYGCTLAPDNNLTICYRLMHYSTAEVTEYYAHCSAQRYA